MDWQEMYESIINSIDTTLSNNGWYKDASGEWTKVLTLSDLGDVHRYIGERPLVSIMNGEAAHVYGVGASGVANFIAGSYVSENFEDNIAETFGLTEEQNDWLGEDDSNWEEISSYIQGWVVPIVDENDIAWWLRQQGF